MTVAREAKISPRIEAKTPKRMVPQPYVVRVAIVPTGTNESGNESGSHPAPPPTKAHVLKKSALMTLTSRTRPDDWRVNSLPPAGCELAALAYITSGPQRG